MKTEILLPAKNLTAKTDLFKVMPVPSVLLWADGPLLSIIEANDAFCSLVGNPVSDFLKGTSFFDVFAIRTDFSQNEWVKLAQKVTLEGSVVKTPLIRFHEKRSGDRVLTGVRYLIASVQAVSKTDGQASQLICTFTDVTELRPGGQFEKGRAVGQHPQLSESTPGFALVGTWEVNLANNSITWSGVTGEIYEVDRDFKPSLDDVLNFIKNDNERVRFGGLLENAIKKGSLFDAELQITTAAGNQRWVRISGEPGYKAGYCNRIYGMVQDTTEDRNTRQLLRDSRNQLRALIQSVNGIFWEADAHGFEFSFVSDHVEDILGYTPQEWMADPHFWENHIHPDDREKAMLYCHAQVVSLKDHVFDYRMIAADGRIVWIKDIVSVAVEQGRPTYLRGLMVDITETKRAEELAVLEKSVLELNTSSNTSLAELLAMYLGGLEEIFPGMKCSLHRVKDHCLELAYAPSIPADYLRELYNVPIGPTVGSCGAAAFLKERVIVADIADDPRWTEYAHLPLMHNLRACWSQPIINSEDVVIATLGFYYDKVKVPDESELNVIERSAAILKIILENRDQSMLLKESSLLMKQGQELAGFGNWQWDVQNNVVEWSEELYAIYGLDRTSFKATFEGYQELLHPDDRERVTDYILGVLRDKTETVFEERIIRNDGEIRYLKSWGRLQCDEKGTPAKMIGACLDITESRKYIRAIEQQNEKLRDIAFQQSHIVRPSLARLMAAVDLLRNYDNSAVENEEILDIALASARELDDIIRDIAAKTQSLPGYF